MLRYLLEIWHKSSYSEYFGGKVYTLNVVLGICEMHFLFIFDKNKKEMTIEFERRKT